MSRLLLMLLPMLVNVTPCSGAAGARHVNTMKHLQLAVAEAAPVSVSTQSPTGLKHLAQGKYSRVETPFIMVSRSFDTYNQMRKLLGSLPDLDSDFFKSYVVVAAFLGQRSNGGYGVEIVFDNKVRIIERTAAPGANVTQQLINPFAVVAIPVEQRNPLFIEPDQTWMKAMASYQVTEAKYTATTGDSSRRKKVKLTGAIDVLRYGSFATLFFHTLSHENLANALSNAALTVQVAQDGSFSAGSHSAESLGRQDIIGKFWDSDRRLSIETSPFNPGASAASEGKYLIEACAQQALIKKP